MAGKTILLCTVLSTALLVMAIAIAPASGSETATESAPTVASTKADLLDLLVACRGEETAEKLLSSTWRFQCPLCALLRSDDWASRRYVEPDLTMIERAIVKPHAEWHSLAGRLERGLRAGARPGSQSGLVDRFDLCWLELGILLEAAVAN